MTGTEVARRQAAAIPAKLQYAHELANSGLLPGQYRKQPANVLWAMEYGEMLGLSPMAAITGVHVIEGKPTASAGLISALVRRAGHKLRITGDSKSATCQIIRSDDPDFTFTVTFTMHDAEQARLTGKDVWKKYGPSMLKARAITQCARDACEEALFGLHYTPEEMGAEVDEDGVVVAEIVEGDPVTRPQQPADPAAANDFWYTQPSPEQEWLAKAVEAAPDRDLDGCTEDWQTSVKHVHDGKLTREEAGRLHSVLRPRMETLKTAGQDTAEPPCDTGGEEVIEGTIVPDASGQAIARLGDSPWADSVRDIPDGDIEQARRLLDEVDKVDMDAAKRHLVRDAILARFPDASDEGQAAA